MERMTNDAPVTTSDTPLGDAVREAIAPHLATRGGLLPALHAVQHAIGHVPDAAVPIIAEALNLSIAEVHGVVSFYHDFRRSPPARHEVKLCLAEACQARGSAAIEAAAVERFGVAMGTQSADGRVALAPVYCLGLCATGPNALVDGRPVSRIDTVMLETIAAEVLA